MAEQHHLRLGTEPLEGNGGLGRYLFLPGGAGCAGRIAEHCQGARRRRTPLPV